MRSPDHIIFGGTFDPPHQGHADCVALAKQAYPEARISIVLSPAPAGAAGEHKRPRTSYADRKQMVNIAMHSLLSDRVQINDIETTLPSPNYSLQTLQALKAIHPKESLALLIGEDQLAKFPLWREPRQILKIADVLVAQRHGEGYLNTSPWQRLGEALDLELSPINNGAYAKDLDACFSVLRGPICEASSTAIRAARENNAKIPEPWLTPELAQWITQKRLYLSAL